MSRAPSPAVRIVSAWMTPALVLAVPVELVRGGREGLGLLLLFAVAPLFAVLATTATRGALPVDGDRGFSVVAALVMAALVIWANLSLAGDVAAWMGVPRWRGIAPAAASALGLMLWGRGGDSRRWLLPVGLFALLLSLGFTLRGAELSPVATWSQVAFQPAFRFGADSPWVTDGRSVGTRGSSLALRFEEAHRVTAVEGGRLRVETSDDGRFRIQEWALAAGQSVMLRPGDRLQVDAPLRLRFEAGKRIPGAPASGIAWAEAPIWGRPLALGRFLGLAVTLVGGAVALGGSANPMGLARFSVGLAGAGVLGVLIWIDCWTVHTLRWVPEVFLGGVGAASLIELPALVFRATPWGAWLTGLALAGLGAVFLAGSLALAERVAPGSGTGRGGLRFRPAVWTGVFTVTALASLRPVDSWWLLQIAFGLGASVLAPLRLATGGVIQARVTAWVLGSGASLFLGLTALGWAGVPSGAAAQVILGYPALVTAPATMLALWLARRLAPS